MNRVIVCDIYKLPGPRRDTNPSLCTLIDIALKHEPVQVIGLNNTPHHTQYVWHLVVLLFISPLTS